jgi:hypothetical protein
MSKVLSKFLFLLKYILLLIAFALVLYGMLAMYGRLDKKITDAISTFIPFIILFLVFVVNLFIGRKYCSECLLLNFGSFLILLVICLICVRAQFDKNMIIYHKYGISYNAAFLADNLASIKSMLYLIAGSNFLFIIASFFDRKNKVKKVSDVAVEESN